MRRPDSFLETIPDAGRASERTRTLVALLPATTGIAILALILAARRRR